MEADLSDCLATDSCIASLRTRNSMESPMQPQAASTRTVRIQSSICSGESLQAIDIGYHIAENICICYPK